MDEKKMHRAPGASAFTGQKRANFYAQIADGLMPKGVSIGGERIVAWPQGELEQINAARIAGKSDDEIRELVIKIESARTGKPATPRRNKLRQHEAAAA